jgi:hypothetical protein
MAFWTRPREGVRGDGDRGQNLKLSLNCYYQSEEIYTQDKYPERWQISQETLKIVDLKRRGTIIDDHPPVDSRSILSSPS